MPDKNYAGNSGLSAVFGVIKSALNNKVDKEAGKGLSTNDYTDEEKATLAGKQDTLTFDTIPTENSFNPVKSGGVYDADEAIRQWTTAEAKSVSGNPITLTDGSARNAEGLAVTCNPKQNLHGYDHPWAGGAGKNKLNAPDITVSNAYVFNDTAVNLSPGTYTFSVFVTGTPTTNTQINILNRTGESSILGYTPIRAGRNTITFTTETAITSVASFTNTTNSVAISEIQIESGSSFTTFAPYSNECPITGYTECVVDRDGLNWWDEEWEIGTINANTGATEANNNRIRSKNYVPVLSGVTYYLKCPSTSNCRIAYYNANKNYIGGSFDLSPNTTFITPSNCAYLKFSPNNDYGTTYNNDICINVSDNSINGQYEPYVTQHTATITFGQTVYGGSVDFKTGKVTVTHGIVDLGTLSWTVQPTRVTGINRFRTGDIISIIKPAPQNNVIANIISSDYRAITAENTYLLYDGDGIGVDTSGAILIYDSTRDTLTAEQFKTAMDGVQLCYELATPTEFTLYPAELELLKGYNYITTNGTTIALAYLPDSLLAEAENYADAKIPPAPSSDGTYVLTCTVTSGIPAYSWESAT